MDNVEDIYGAIFEAARLDPSKPLRRGAIELVERILGRCAVYESADPSRELVVDGRAGSRRFIGIRRGTLPVRANFVVAKGLTQILLERWGIEPTEELVRRVAASLVVPPVPFREAIAAGVPLPYIARFNSTSQSVIVLRVGEVLEGRSSALLTEEGKVYGRGPGLVAHLPSEDLVRLAAKPIVKCVERRRLTDERGRIAFFQRPT